MKKTYYKTAVFLVSVIILMFITSVSADAAAAPGIITPDEIRPGMKGYGLTVFKGTEPEKFDVVVEDVVHNFMLKQDIILIRCIHPVTDKAGVIGGMSGSPIYISGKLAGALAYGWSFSKEALAGVSSDFINAINTGQNPVSNSESGLAVVRILEASQHSIKHMGAEVIL